MFERQAMADSLGVAHKDLEENGYNPLVSVKGLSPFFSPSIDYRPAFCLHCSYLNYYQ